MHWYAFRQKFNLNLNLRREANGVSQIYELLQTTYEVMGVVRVNILQVGLHFSAIR